MSGSAAERSRQQSRQTATLLAFRHGVPLRSAKTTRPEVANKLVFVPGQLTHSNSQSVKNPTSGSDDHEFL